MKRFPIVLASLAVLVAACGGTTAETTAAEADGGDDGQTQDQTSTSTTTSEEESGTSDPLDPGDDGELTINDFIPGAFNFDENTDWRAQELEIQQQVAVCMAAEGFEYIPFVPSDVGGGFGPGEFDEEEYVKTYGFGVSTWVLQEEQFQEGEFEDPYANDPNMEIVDAMDDFEREEYYRVLYGGEPEIIENTPVEEIEAMTDEEREAFYNEAYENWMPDGCYNEASEAAYGRDGDAQMAFWDEFGEDYEDVYTRAQSDPRILDAQAKWSACMAEKGYDYANQEEMYAYFWGTESGGNWVEGEFQQRVNELITWPEYPDEGFVEGEEGESSGSVGVATTVIGVGGEGEDFEYQGPEYDIEELQPLIDEEIAIATADYGCSQFMREVFEEVYQEYEQRFIDENLDRLVEFKEANS